VGCFRPLSFSVTAGRWQDFHEDDQSTLTPIAIANRGRRAAGPDVLWTTDKVSIIKELIAQGVPPRIAHRDHFPQHTYLAVAERMSLIRLDGLERNPSRMVLDAEKHGASCVDAGEAGYTPRMDRLWTLADDALLTSLHGQGMTEHQIQ
jgi:hypothetical protein